MSTDYRDPTYSRVLAATRRPGPLERARVKVVPEATKQFVDDGWLALALFGTVLLLLILQG